jgi:DNA-binding winged helix-turn-helix (wHTH) protein/tetratricopeptide (TPR) repeat protein
VIYRFAACELDPSAGELRRGGQAVAVQPKPLALLTLLIEERHRIVPSEELLERLWPEETVTSSSLSRAVSVARSAIGDGGRSGLIRSYTRRGYRFHGDVVELDDESAATEGAAAAPSDGGMPFVGRAQALSRLRAAWTRATRGHEGVVLVSGPAGVGKTRLTEVFESEVSRRGGLVLRGRALEEEGEPAFWVWAQMLRRLQQEDPESLHAPGLAESGELAALMPELAAHVGPTAALPAEQRRFVFFDALARALRAAARKRPLLIVFEDLHWADPASLRLLEHLAFELDGAEVLLVATVRDEPETPNDPSLRTRSVLRRRERLETLSLERLDAAEVESLIEQLAGRPLPDLAQRLRRRTDGLPLFLREACRRLEELGALEDPSRLDGELPLPGVDWVKDALTGLTTPCATLLGAAAAIGREFSLPLAAAAADLRTDAALDLLDEAVHAGIVAASPDDHVRYAFVHDLFREAAYQGLGPGARVRTHHRAARHLERMHGAHLDPVIAELAHHHHRSLAVGDPERAFQTATRAAERAYEVCAYEQAVLHGKQALAALDHIEGADPDRRLTALLDLGESSRLSGERRQRRHYFGQALELARATGRSGAIATAAIGLCDLAEWGVRDDVAKAAVEEALACLERPAVDVEAKLLTRLGYLNAMFEQEEAEKLLRRAVALTRELGAADPLEEALYALHLVLGGPDRHEERVEILDELRGAASAARDPVASVIAVLDVACDELERGRSEEAARLRREADTTAGVPPHPRTLWHRHVYDTGMALLEGRLGEVEGRADEALALGRRLQHPYAVGCFNAHRAHLHAVRLDHEALVASLEPALGARQGPTDWVKIRVARSQLALGRGEAARALYDDVLAAGPAGIPRNLRWIATLVEVAHCCADLEDADSAAALIESLSPYEHRHGVMPMVICYGGPVSWALARLYETRGRTDDASELYDEALSAAADLGARPSEAHIRIAQARLLRRLGSSAAAREQLARAAAVASDLGMTRVEQQACDALSEGALA